MADSCRPVSRHGRYNSTGPSSVQYSGDVSPYGGVDYTASDEMYTVNQPQRPPERPKTGRGRRRRAEAPPRPESRRGDERRHFSVNDEENETYGRPMSRVGFSPDQSSYSYSHDEFSRQQSSDNEKPIVNSPSSSPEILYQDENYFATQKSLFAPTSQQPEQVDRLIVSPSNPMDVVGKGHSRKHRKSPQMFGQSPQTYGQSPQGSHRGSLSQSPQYEAHHNRPSPKLHGRPSSREYMNVSPLQRNEYQIQEADLHHHDTGPYMSEDPYSHEGDSYQQRFSGSPRYQNSPYQENTQYRDSPSYVRDSPYHNNSPSHGGYGGYAASPDSRPPPAPRPKSSRPRTAGRKKSARVRQQQHRHQEQETSLPQQCDTTSILNSGDPYGRPSSSLSPYKPLPAIGTPRTPPEKSDDRRDLHDSPSELINKRVDNVTVETKRMMLEESAQFHPADENADIFRVEDIQGASGENYGNYTGQGLPGVDDLTNLPQMMSDEIFKSSVSNFEKHVSGDLENNEENAGNNETEHSGFNTSPTIKPLDFLHELPAEPGEGEDRILLAIKLPDGKRIQRHFSPSDKLVTVMHFAENDNLVSYADYQIVCNAPRTTFTDLTMLIADTQLRDRTVLYLEEKD